MADTGSSSLRQEVHKCIAEQDPQAFIAVINSRLTSGQRLFRDLQEELVDVLKAETTVASDTDTARKFLLQCLTLLLAPAADIVSGLEGTRLSAGLPFLLLDAVPPATCTATGSSQGPDAFAGDAGHSVQQGLEQGSSTAQGLVRSALELLCSCIQANQVKTGLRIAQAYGLTSLDLQSHLDLLHQMQALCDGQLKAGRPGLVSACSMIMQFDVLGQDVDIQQLVVELVDAGQETLAERWLVTLDRRMQEVYVEACVAAGKLKPALRVVRAFQLSDTFPDLEQTYRQKALNRLIERGLWQVAGQYVGNDRALQEQLITAVATEDIQQAQDFAEEWGLPASILGPLLDPEARAAAEAARAAQFHGLALPIESVLLVNDLATVKEAHTVLAAATVVGLDAEWRPSANQAALLQIGTTDRVFLFDLPALLFPSQPAHQQAQEEAQDAGATPAAPVQITADPELVAATDDCLVAVFQNPACLKVGLEVGGDLKKLAGSCPGLRVWSQPVGPVLEIRDLWVEHLAATNPHVSKLQQGAGLSSLCTALHGKPLDKTMQMSDWERRPLTKRQMLYAAQDAHVLVTMYERLRQLVPHADQVVQAKQFTYQAANGSAVSGEGSAKRSRTAAAAVQVPQRPKGPAPPDSLAGASGPPTASQAGAGQDWATPGRGAPAVVAALAAAGLLHCLLDVPAAEAAAGPGIATAVAAAQSLGVALDLVIKSIAVMVAGSGTWHHYTHAMAAPGEPCSSHAKQVPRPWLVALRGNARLDLHKVAHLAGVSRKAVRIATAQECINVFGYPPGCLPAFGLACPDVHVVLDRSLACPTHGQHVTQAHSDSNDVETGRQVYYAGSGTLDTVVALSLVQLAQLTGARIEDVSCSGENEPGPKRSSTDEQEAGHDAHSNGNRVKELPAFLLDSMLGKLCRWLRCLGVDSDLISKPMSRAELAQMAATCGRILLTRDARLAVRSDAVAAAPYLLGSDDPVIQLREVAAHWGLVFDKDRAMTRCSNCNSSAFELMTSDEAEPLVPTSVFKVVTEFFRCGQCGKIFWMGPKSYSALNHVETLLNGCV